jgi:hypothetical protein
VIRLAGVYLACWIRFGLATFVWIGFILPILSIIGAGIAPTEIRRRTRIRT